MSEQSKTAFELCTQGHYQIEAMCKALLQAAQSQDPETNEVLPYLVQSLAIRIDTLNGALMNAVGTEDDEVIADLRREVTHG